MDLGSIPWRLADTSGVPRGGAPGFGLVSLLSTECCIFGNKSDRRASYLYEGADSYANSADAQQSKQLETSIPLGFASAYSARAATFAAGDEFYVCVTAVPGPKAWQSSAAATTQVDRPFGWAFGRW